MTEQWLSLKIMLKLKVDGKESEADEREFAGGVKYPAPQGADNAK